MKKILFAVLGTAALAFSATSCTEDGYLKEEMVATITQDFYKTEAGLDALTTGLYDHVKAFWMRADTGNTGRGFSAGMMSDCNDTGSVDQFALTSYSPSGNARYSTIMLWYQNNPYFQRWGIYACYNDALTIINYIDNNAEEIGGKYLDAEYAAKQKSIALFVKDWMMYLLTDMLGDVYVPQEPTSKDAGVYYGPKTTAENMWSMFISDMEYAYQHLPSPDEFSGALRSENITKYAAAQFLAHLYWDRAMGNKFKSLRNADGTYSHDADKALGMLYKGGSFDSDVDNCIKWCNTVINSGSYELEPNYSIWGKKVNGKYDDEASREIVWSISASSSYMGEKNNNGAWGWRTEDYYGRYRSAYWGLQNYVWTYGGEWGYRGITNFGIGLFTNKFIDSRYDKSFFVEYYPLTAQGSVDVPYTSYLDPDNGGGKWLENMNPYDKSDASKANKYVDWFNNNKVDFFTEASPYASRVKAVVSGADYKTSSNNKLNGGDISVVMIMNDREHAIDADLCHSMPFIVNPLWSYYTDNEGKKHYYTGQYSYEVMTQNPHHGEPMASVNVAGRPFLSKYIDPNRLSVHSETAGRNVAAFRLADLYLLRAWAYGMKHDYESALRDINIIRERAGYNAGEVRPMAIAQFSDYYPGNEVLSDSEKVYPYTVASSTKAAMRVDSSYWTPGNANFEAENYPHYLTSAMSDRDGNSLSLTDMNAGFTSAEDFYFANFMMNEYSRELMGETVMAFIPQFSGLRYTRLMWHNQDSSTLNVDENGKSIWPEAAENSSADQYQNGKSRGYIKPYNIWDPYLLSFLDKLTDENGQPLDDAARAEYQNPGYQN